MSHSKVAIVTAASRGMGKACAELLSKKGYQLALLASSDEIQEVAKALGAIYVQGSVTDETALESLVQKTQAHYGRIDAVVNNTGHPPKGPLLELSDDDWHKGLDMVLLNVVRMARLVTPMMEKQGQGSIVNISTFAAFEPSLTFPISSSLRAALGSFTKLYSDQYAQLPIRMNNVLPGFVDSYPVNEETLKDIPMGRSGNVAEVAQAVAYLLSDEASYITGQNLRVDGGITRSV